MKKIAVYCGSNFGTDKTFEKQAYLLGKKLAKEKIELIYGGAKIGLMGALANGCLEENGKVIGILPKFLKSKESAHEMLTELILVDTMHERKNMINDLSDAIIALPGGIGTLEELIEMLTWKQIGLHEKPIGILNINGFYEPLISLFQTMVDYGFMKKENVDKIIISENINELIQLIRNYENNN